MKKFILYLVLGIILSITIILLFTDHDKDIKIDIKELASDIIENVEFEDELNEVNEQIARKLYNIDNALNEIVYVSSGATAEEIAIFEFETKDDCKKAVNKAKTRIEEQKASFKDYMPKEVKKLDNAIILNKNNYLIICVTNNQKGVEEILDKYIK